MADNKSVICYLIVHPDPFCGSHIRVQSPNHAAVEQHWVKIGDTKDPNRRRGEYIGSNPGSWFLAIDVKSYPVEQKEKIGTVLKELVFGDRGHDKAEGTTEWFCIENQSASLAKARNDLKDVIHVDTIVDASRVLLDYIRGTDNNDLNFTKNRTFHGEEVQYMDEGDN